MDWPPPLFNDHIMRPPSPEELAFTNKYSEMKRKTVFASYNFPSIIGTRGWTHEESLYENGDIINDYLDFDVPVDGYLQIEINLSVRAKNYMDAEVRGQCPWVFSCYNRGTRDVLYATFKCQRSFGNEGIYWTSPTQYATAGSFVRVRAYSANFFPAHVQWYPAWYPNWDGHLGDGSYKCEYQVIGYVYYQELLKN